MNWIKNFIKSITPGPVSIKGAAKGLLFFTALAYLFNAVVMAIEGKDAWVLLPGIAFVMLFLLSALFVDMLLTKLQKIPRYNKLVLFLCLPLLFVTFMFDPLVVAIIVFISSLMGAVYYVIRKTGFKRLATSKKVVLFIGLAIGVAGIGAGIYYYFQRGLSMDPMVNAAKLNAGSIAHLPGDSPAKPGVFKVRTITYGSGKDKHRPEFGAKATHKTSPVDGTAFLDNWKGLGGWWRKQYWGFNAKALPINARVWYPEGNGPFPLVLVVHGNHGMTDFSDPGYDYLGEMLASRGMIVASVDENFINGNWSDITGGLKKENDARGWLLLEHLKVWHQWNAKNDHAFFGKVDTGRIALIGHSRGGEAVAHAALFNVLDYYPDDASVKLGYHYNLRGIVAIAPVDGQYQPGETLTKIGDVDYFTIHGSQDGDVTSFMGSSQFERIKFTGNNYHFKSGLYVYGANHGQFNTSWGDNDFSLAFKGLFNLKQLLPAKDQQEIAKVYISAFLETSLLGKTEYLPLFTDARTARKWLPETVYLNQFEDANTRYVARYDEDFEVTTGTMDSVGLMGENLSVWREQEIQLKQGKKGTRAVFLGWHYDSEKVDSVEKKKIRDWVPDSVIASYTIELEPGIVALDTTSVLVFSMAESKEESNPKASGKWVEEDKVEDEVEVDGEKKVKAEVEEEEKVKVEAEVKGEKGKVEDKVKAEVEKEKVEAEKKEKKKKEEKDKPKKAPEPLDMTIELTDRKGQVVSFPLSRFSALQRELEVRIWKMDFLKGKKESEKVFQKFAFPLADIQKMNPSFSAQSLQKIRFVFDRTADGVVVLDNLGFMKRLDLVERAQ